MATTINMPSQVFTWPDRASKAKRAPELTAVEPLPTLFRATEFWDLIDEFMLGTALNSVERYEHQYANTKGSMRTAEWREYLADADALCAGLAADRFFAEDVVSSRAKLYAQAKQADLSGKAVILPEVIGRGQVDSVFSTITGVAQLPAGTVAEARASNQDQLDVCFKVPGRKEFVASIYLGQWQVDRAFTKGVFDFRTADTPARLMAKIAVAEAIDEHPELPTLRYRSGEAQRVEIFGNGKMIRIALTDGALSVERNGEIVPPAVADAWMQHVFQIPSDDVSRIRLALTECLEAAAIR